VTLYKDIVPKTSLPIARGPLLIMLAEYGYDPQTVVGLRFDAESQLEIDVVDDERTPPIADRFITTFIHEFDDDPLALEVPR
jgi:hypothetical protein